MTKRPSSREVIDRMKNTVNDRVIELKKAICFLESGGEAAILINKKPILITKPGKH